MEFKLVKPGTHMLQDLDMDEQVLNLIDKAVDFDEEAMQYMESLLSKTDRSERNTNQKLNDRIDTEKIAKI